MRLQLRDTLAEGGQRFFGRLGLRPERRRRSSRRFSPSGVRAGILPSDGSTINEERLVRMYFASSAVLKMLLYAPSTSASVTLTR